MTENQHTCNHTYKSGFGKECGLVEMINENSSFPYKLCFGEEKMIDGYEVTLSRESISQDVSS